VISGQDKTPKWETTRKQHLYRHSKSGRYYVRGFSQGREIWKALKTTNFQVASIQADKKLAEINKPRNLSDALLGGKPTVGQAAELYKAKVETDVGIKESSKSYRYQTIKALFRSWPELQQARISAVTIPQCREWAKKFLHSKRACGHKWKTKPTQTISATRFNNTVDTLRHIFQIGIEHGVITSNPADSIGKVTPKQKPMRIPSSKEFSALVREVRNADGAVSQCSADLIEFLAYTGLRIGEARWVKWDHIEEARSRIVIYGNPKTGTKNNTLRRIPIIDPLKKLLTDMRQMPRYPRSEARRKDGFVLAVTECQKAIDRACTRLGIARFTHHDLRHLFATVAIESEVDIPTLSQFLGHKDGGVLAMKTYGHLRDDHAQAMAAKITF
jgi:integrase